MSSHLKQRGFTIVEIAIVLIIFGMVSATVLYALRTYTEEARIEKTKKALENSMNAVSLFVGENGRYPCPAERTDAEGSANYGLEVISGLNPAIPADLTILQANLAAIERVGQADIDNTDGDNNVKTGIDPDETYVYGAIPFKTILNSDNLGNITGIREGADVAFSKDDTIDGWGNKLTYVVSRHLCDPTSAEAGNPRGVLDVVTEGTCISTNSDAARNGNTEQQSILPGDCDANDRSFAQFVIVSHGPNGRGAYNAISGQRTEVCVNTTPVLPPPPVGTLDPTIWAGGFASERMNCKYDLAGNHSGMFFAGLKSEGQDNAYFDDYIKFYYDKSRRIWASGLGIKVNAGLPTEYTITQVLNVNPGNIGIGTNTPQEVMQVDGDIQAYDILAEQYCQDLGNGICMTADVLAGAGMVCPAGEVIKTISQNTVQCTDPFASLSFACPAGLYMQRVRSDGTQLCCDTGMNCNWY